MPRFPLRGWRGCAHLSPSLVPYSTLAVPALEGRECLVGMAGCQLPLSVAGREGRRTLGGRLRGRALGTLSWPRATLLCAHSRNDLISSRREGRRTLGGRLRGRALGTLSWPRATLLCAHSRNDCGRSTTLQPSRLSARAPLFQGGALGGVSATRIYLSGQPDSPAVV